MKRLAFFGMCILLLCVSWIKSPERKLIGSYTGGFGDAIQLRSDSTFFYKWHFDLMYSWNRGTWKSNGDTIWLETVPVYDTLTLNRHSAKQQRDSLILSHDTVPQRLNDVIINLGHTSGQGGHSFPHKLIYLNDRLYLPDAKGKPDKKSRIEFGSEKYPTYYQRVDPLKQ